MTKQRTRASLVGMAMLLITTTLAAQVTEEWVARYDGPVRGDDAALAIAIDGAGNVYVTGESYGWETSCDYATIKYSPSGVKQWVARYNGPANDTDRAQAIALDRLGNVYVTGESYGWETSCDYATVKYSPSGVKQWVARYNGPESYGDYATAIAVDGAGNVYVTGYSELSSDFFAPSDYATIKYSPSGVKQWVARYDGLASGEDAARAIAIDDAGNVYVTGYSEGDYATVKYNSSGVEQWVARYDGYAATAIAIDDAGNVYITGKSGGSETLWDYATVKYNSSGDELWVARYDGPESLTDLATAIAVDSAGNVYVTGYSELSSELFPPSDYATVKYSSNGEELWVARYGGTVSRDIARAMAIDGAGNVYVTGRSEGSGLGADYATVKYDSSGVEQWVARYDATSGRDWDVANAIAIDDAGNVYVTGSSADSETGFDYATIKYSQGPGVAEASPDVPGHRLEVAQLAPHPVITYTLPSSSSISLKVYDVTGKLVRTLVSGSQEAGTHTLTWDGRDGSGQQLSSGLYFIRLAAPEFGCTAKVIVVR